MNKFFIVLLFGCFFCFEQSVAQKITFSELDKQDKGDINFEIIGKMNTNFLIYKNLSWRHKITVYDNGMKEIETVKLDFLPEKTFNVDFIAYPTYSYMVYQYQKKNILYCMMVKLDAMGKKITEPQPIDTTQLSFFADNKIYTTVVSENKESIEIFKLFKKNDNYTLATKLFDKNFNLIHQTRMPLALDDRREIFDNFLLDNEGNLVFTKQFRENNRSSINKINLSILKKGVDTLVDVQHNIEKNYVDNVTLKIDNLNNTYLVNAFYYKKNRGSVEGVYAAISHKNNLNVVQQSFAPIYDSVRDIAKKEGQLRFALDDFYIQQIISKKDGGFIVVTEDFTSQRVGGNNTFFNRWDYANNSFGSNNYYYSPTYGYYRPYNSFSNQQSIRYYYSNILVISFNALGKIEWSRVIQKDQFDEGSDDYLSFSAIPFNGELHFLFNIDKKNQIIADNSINGNGELKRNPTLKTEEKGHQFMPKHSKQVGAKQIIIPCNYRGYLCFAKIDV